MLVILQVIDVASQIYFWMIIGYVLLSWFPHARESSIGNLLSTLVEPYLSVFRRFIPPLGMIDLSPIVALFAFKYAVSGLQFILINLYNLTVG